MQFHTLTYCTSAAGGGTPKSQICLIQNMGVAVDSIGIALLYCGRWLVARWCTVLLYGMEFDLLIRVGLQLCANFCHLNRRCVRTIHVSGTKLLNIFPKKAKGLLELMVADTTVLYK